VLRRRGERSEPVLGATIDDMTVAEEKLAEATPARTAPPEAIIAAPVFHHRHAVEDDTDDDYLDRNDEASPRPHWARLLTGLLIVLALLALAGQALWLFRTDLAAAVPSARPLLEALCQPLACTVGYARHPDLWVVTASSLQTEPITQPGEATRLRLNVTLHNRHTQAQHWPALMLELRDFSDTVVVRRALLPDEYLSSPNTPTQPLAAGTPAQLSVTLTVSGVQVNGYQVHPFYP